MSALRLKEREEKRRWRFAVFLVYWINDLYLCVSLMSISSGDRFYMPNLKYTFPTTLVVPRSDPVSCRIMPPVACAS